MKKQPRKLQLSTQTIATLTKAELDVVAGGMPPPKTQASCRSCAISCSGY